MKWIQLSDLHFNYENYDTDDLKKDLLRILGDIGKVDFITISGDCLYQFQTSEQIEKDLKAFVNQITAICEVRKSDLFITPGNHDVNRNDIERQKRINKVRRKKFTQISQDDISRLQEVGYDRFKSIHKKLTNREYRFSQVIPREKFNIVNIDTCLLSYKNDDKKLICSFPKTNNLSKSTINIVLMHHGVEYFTPTYAKKFQMWAQDNDIDIVLCGHSHRAGLKNFDELPIELKQFTCGSAVVDEYAIPSFYLYDYDEHCGRIEVYLYTFSTETNRWDLDRTHIRAFQNGQYTYYVPRQNQYVRNDLNNNTILSIFTESERNLIKSINDKFKNWYGNKFYNSIGKQMKFNADTAVYSIVQMNVPYRYAIEIVNTSVNTICTQEFYTETKGEIHSNVFRGVIYDTICNLSPTDSIYDQEDINTLASKYARRYGHNNQHLKIIKKTNEILLNYEFVMNLFDDILRQAANLDKYSLTSSEKINISESILSFIQNLDVYTIDYYCLKDFITEIITSAPHPWLLTPKKEKQFRLYHFGKAKNHFLNLKTKINELTIIETVYHCTALFISYYTPLIGCSEKYPITILIKALNSIKNSNYHQDEFFNTISLVELSKDLNALSIDVNNLLQTLVDISKKLKVRIDNIDNDYIEHIIDFSNLTFKLKKYYDKKEMQTFIYEPGKSISVFLSSYFASVRGFFVKQPLKQVPTCFWITPHFSEGSINLRQLLVAEINPNNFESIIKYTKTSNCNEPDKAVLFVQSDFSPFPTEAMDKITSLKSPLTKCYFFNRQDFSSIQKSSDSRTTFKQWLINNSLTFFN